MAADSYDFLKGHYDRIQAEQRARDLECGEDHLVGSRPDDCFACLAEQRDALLAVLRDLEWIGMNDGRGVTHSQCPACSALKSRGSGHNHYCGLAAAIAKAEGR